MTGPLRARGPYRIQFEKEAHKGLFLIARTHNAAFAEACELLATVVSEDPSTWIPGKLKALKGSHAGVYQLSLAGAHRVLYTIDEAEKLVYVEYCGRHPDWK